MSPLHFPSFQTIVNHLDQVNSNIFNCTRNIDNGQEVKYCNTLAAAFAEKNVTMKEFKSTTHKIIANWIKNNEGWEGHNIILIKITVNMLYKMTKKALLDCANLNFENTYEKNKK